MRFRPFARHVGAASLAGIVAGMLVAGVLGRIAMRVAGFLSRPELIGVETSNGNRVGEITLAGTIVIAVFAGISAGLLGGALYASAEPWLRRLRWRGVVFGVALLGGIGFTVIEPANFDFRRFGSAGLNVLLFAALFVAYGVLVAWLFERIRDAIAKDGAIGTVVEIAAWLAALLSVVLVAGAFVSIGGIDDPLLLVLAAVVLVVPAIVRWRALPRVIAYLAFAAPFVVGAVRTLAGMFEIAF
ncbi:MAG: hypothetical protein M3R54_02560 [Chloroflexota bacterium]|nr:hypothetical protein [Chloroflexota bacterium]